LRQEEVRHYINGVRIPVIQVLSLGGVLNRNFLLRINHHVIADGDCELIPLAAPIKDFAGKGLGIIRIGKAGNNKAVLPVYAAILEVIILDKGFKVVPAGYDKGKLPSC